MMLQFANHTQFELTVDTLHLSVISYQLKDLGFNSLFQLSVKVTIDKVIEEALVRKQASFKIISPHPFYLYGEISSFTLFQKNGQIGLYELIINPRLKRLTLSKRTDYYSDELLSTLLDRLLKTYQIHDVRLRFTDKTIPFLLQYQQSDWDFFMYLIIRFGLIFYFDLRHDYTSLVISDKRPKGSDISLNLIASSDGLVKESPIAFDKVIQQTLLPDNLSVHAQDRFSLNEHHLSQTNNQSGHQGLGTYHLALPYACDTADECTQLAKTMQASLDWQRELIQLKTNMLSIKVGDRLYLKDSQDNRFIVLNLSSQGSEAHAIHFKPDTLKAPFNTLILMPDTLEYKLPHPLLFLASERPTKDVYVTFLNEDKTLPQLFFQSFETQLPMMIPGRIAKSDRSPPVYIRGYYEVHLDINPDKKTPLIPLTLPGTQPKGEPFYGCHFSLYESTPVMIGFLNDSLERPFVLGVYDEDDEQSLVSLYSPNEESKMTLDGTPHKEALLFQSPQCKIDISAKLDITFKTGGDAHYRSQSLSYQIGGDASLHAKSLSLVGNALTWQIGEAVFWEAKHLNIEGPLKLSAYGRVDVEVAKAGRIEAQTIQMSSLEDTLLKASDSLSIECPGIHVCFTSSGQILINGNPILCANVHSLSPNCIVIKGPA